MGESVHSDGMDGDLSTAEPDEMEWVIVKTLLDANSRSSEALEHHLLRTYYQEQASDIRVMRNCVEQAITKHERIIEDLQLTLEALGELDGE